MDKKAEIYDYDVFLSYQNLDESFATKLASRIQSENYNDKNLRVFFAPWDIAPGDNIVSKINDGLSKAKFFLLVISPEALSAEWPSAEQSAAIYSDPSGRLRRVIPIMRRYCSLPPLLRIRNYANFVKDSDFEIQFQRILKVITGKPASSEQAAAKNLSLQRVPLQQTNTLLIDDIPEKLYSNLFPASHPETVFSAPTKFFERRQVYKYFEGENPPAFILKENRLFCFVNLRATEHEFKGAVEEYDIQRHDFKDWLKASEKARWSVELLNDAFRVLSFQVGLRLDKNGKKSYFPKGNLASEKIDWKAHQKTAGRHLIKERRNEQGQTLYFIHRALDARFTLIDAEPFLRCETGRVFSTDGTNLIEGRRRSVLSTRLLARQRNLQEFDDTRFWTWLLSDDGRTMLLDFGRVTVATTPLSVEVNGGIYGDTKEIPAESVLPPDLAQELPEMGDQTEMTGADIEEFELDEQIETLDVDSEPTGSEEANS